MRIVIVLIIGLILLNCSKEKGKEHLVCTDFKVGKFQLIDKDAKRNYVIERTKDLQIEQTFDLVTKKKIKRDKYFKISWKNDCEYSLQVDTLKSEHDKIDLYINSKGGYRCSIKKIEGNCSIIKTKVDEDVFTSKICKVH